jgi:hypothetical protein
MVTYALILVSAIAGLLMIGAGLWGGARLMSERRRITIPLRYYAIIAGMIGTGIGLLGIAQALRLLIWIYGGVGADSGDFR